MKRIAVLFAAALIGAALPAAAEAQGRGRPGMDCPQGPAGKACRQAQRGGGDDDRGDRGGERRSRPPGRDDDYETQRSRPPGRGGNSLGDGWNPRESDARDAVRGGRNVPLEQVIRNISRSNPGQLLDAGLEQRGDRPIYRVRWQTNDGRRIDFIVDARTGQIIGRN